MKYLLDTNICIHFFRGKFNLIEKFQEVKLENCAISEITVAELTFGAENSLNPKKNTFANSGYTPSGHPSSLPAGRSWQLTGTGNVRFKENTSKNSARRIAAER